MGLPPPPLPPCACVCVPASQASKTLQDRDEQLSRVTGIVRRTMESIRAGYQRRSAEDPAFVGEGDERDEALLDADSFDGVEALLGSLAQFAANKSHKVLRLRQELHRKTEEISQLEDELQRSWSSASQKAVSQQLVGCRGVGGATRNQHGIPGWGLPQPAYYSNGPTPRRIERMFRGQCRIL